MYFFFQIKSSSTSSEYIRLNLSFETCKKYNKSKEKQSMWRNQYFVSSIENSTPMADTTWAHFQNSDTISATTKPKRNMTVSLQVID